MKNVIKYKGNNIVRWVTAFNFLTDEPMGEFDTMNEAKREYADRKGLVYFRYAAAETINKDGDCNPAVYGVTLKEATEKLKKLL